MDSTNGISPNTKLQCTHTVIPADHVCRNLRLVSRKRSCVASKKKSLQYMFRISLENGEHYDVTGDQRLVLSNRDRSLQFYMSVRDCLKVPENLFNHYYVNKGTFNWDTKNVLIDPFFLGCWLGARLCDQSGFNTSWSKAYKATGWLNLHNKNYVYYKNFNYIEGDRIHSALRDYNLSFYNKFIPRDYKYNDITVRTNLLRGFVLTAECFTKRNKVFLRYDNKCLADDFVFLARSLGYKAHVKRNRIVFNLMPSTSYRFNIIPLGVGECVTITGTERFDSVLTDKFDEILI